MQEKPNFHQLHKERNILREIDNEGELPLGHNLKDLEEKHEDFHISDYGSLSEAKRELRFQKETFKNGLVIDWVTIQKELGVSDYNLLEELEKKECDFKKIKSHLSKRLREMNNNPEKTVLLKTLIGAYNDEIAKQEKDLTSLEAENEEVSRIRLLLAYREGLFEEGHIAEVNSTKNYLGKIEEAMIEGKPMFLHGPTGTGKTSLAIRAAKILTNKHPEMVYCNPQTKESTLFGKVGIVIDEETKQQVTKTVLGHLSTAVKEGKVIIFDEFTALPKELMVIFKGLMSLKVGDTFTIPGDGEVIIASGFQMIFTANLKSDKNRERNELPPEVKNEFAQNNIEIKYQSVNESYDIILARLMNADGSIDMSEYDMEITLKKLCEAVYEIQTAYNEGVENDLGGKEGLKDFVLNQRNIENILSRWKTVKTKKEEIDFVTFLDKQLSIALTFKDYSKKDRELASKTLALKGLLSTIKAEELGLASDTFSFNTDISLKAVNKSRQIKRYTLREVSDIDPFNLRKEKINEEVDELLAGIKSNEALENQSLKVNKNQLQESLKNLGSKAEIDENIESGIISLEIDNKTLEKLKDWPSAKKAYKEADNNSDSYIWDMLDDIPYTKPYLSSLDILVLNHGKTTPQERDKLVEDMDKSGYRPLDFSELIALAIIKPELNKRNEIFNTYKKYPLGGVSQSPFFYWSGGGRGLNADNATDGWGGRGRFLFVRK